MSVIQISESIGSAGGYPNPRVSVDLRSYGSFTGWPGGRSDLGVTAAASTVHVAALAHPVVINGVHGQCYMDDFYYRVWLTPARLDLGQLSTAQVRNVNVWNAWPNKSLTLADVDAQNAGGIEVVAPGGLPFVFLPLRETTWQVNISNDGPGKIDATLTWQFDDASQNVALVITGNRLTAWTFIPNWAYGISERLSWLTRLAQSPTAAEQRASVRLSPRAVFEFQPLVHKLERSLFDLAMFDAGARNWVLPIWHDIEWLAAPVAAGASHIPVSEGVRDFHAGGLALLRSESAFTYEIAEIESADATGIALTQPLQNAWPVGTRLYPARQARLAQQPTASRRTDNLWTVPVQFQLAESYDFPAAPPPTLYRGVPVLEDNPEESDDLPTSWDRFLDALDNDIGLPNYVDTANRPFEHSGHAWKVQGRSEHARLRGLFYFLAGRRQVVWKPTFAQDLEPTATIAANATSMLVAYTGYTRYSQGRAGKRDICIQRIDGSRLYRRITGAIEVNATTEQLALDASLGVTLAPSDILRISYVALVRLNSDDLEIQHVNAPSGDRGGTNISTVFRALRDDLELPA